MTIDMSTAIGVIQKQLEAEASALSAATIQPNTQDATSAQGAMGFAESFKHAIQQVDAQGREAAEKMAAVDSGRSDDLVGAMLASQEASLSFSMLMQVRNKVVGAMEDLIKLPL